MAYASTALALVVGLALVVAVASLGRGPLGAPKVQFGRSDSVYYTRRTTKEDAIALGRALKEIGFFVDHGAAVVLTKGTGGTVVSFVLHQGAWNVPDTVSTFGEIGRRIGPSVGGFPFRLWLVDEKLVMQKDLAVGKETIGTRDIVYYYGSATSQDALALGQSLRSAGAMQDRGSTVVLAKGDGTTVSFVVQQKPWERPETVAVFESLMRQIAPSVGGLPLRLRFLDAGGVLHKEVSIL